MAITGEKKTFRVDVERDGAWWFVKAPEVQGAYSQVKRLDQVDEDIRPLISYFTDLPEDAFEISVDVKIEQTVQEALAQLEQIRQEADRITTQASELTRQLVLLLDEQGLAQRDVGSIVGLSFQRVSQLLKQRPRPAPARS